MKAKIESSIAANPLLTAADAPLIEAIATSLLPTGDEQTQKAVQSAARCVSDFRHSCRYWDGLAYAKTIPVRKAVPAGNGGGRYYWRVVYPDGGIAPAVKNSEKNKGTLADAHRYATDAYCRGTLIKELIPPDIDPQQPNEWTENRAPFQPSGMTVRMRTKKH